MEAMTDNALVEIVHQSGLAIEKATALIEIYSPLVAEAGELCREAAAVVVTDATQVTEMKNARAIRLKLRDVRIRAEKARKGLKEDALKTGKAIDGANNWLLSRIEPEESRLECAEKFAERAEAAIQAKLKQDRTEALRPFGVDGSFYQLGTMPEPQWVQLFENTQAAHHAKIEATNRAEADRIAAETARVEEAKKLREENLRLQAERDAVRQKADSERAALEATARKEREVLEAKLRVERDSRMKVEAEQRQQREAEDRCKVEQAEAVERAAAAPDIDKLKAFASILRVIDYPKVQSTEAKHAVELAKKTIEDTADDFEALSISMTQFQNKRKIQRA